MQTHTHNSGTPRKGTGQAQCGVLRRDGKYPSPPRHIEPCPAPVFLVFLHCPAPFLGLTVQKDKKNRRRTVQKDCGATSPSTSPTVEMQDSKYRTQLHSHDCSCVYLIYHPPIRHATGRCVVRLRSGLAATGLLCKRSVHSLIPSPSGILSCTKYQKRQQVMSKLYAHVKKSLDSLKILK
jgi:hypothetical protein